MLLGLVIVLLYWALGARSLGWRWVRPIGVVIIAMPILAVTLLTPQFVGGAGCM
jgi:hypothetical protein